MHVVSTVNVCVHSGSLLLWLHNKQTHHSDYVVELEL